MLADLDHPFADGEPVYDVTFENVQAGLRTDYLFRLANQRGGIVLGTGDLSELALGWCTYGVGDQMSHYAVNAGVPKTLIQHLIRWVIAERPVRRRRPTRCCSDRRAEDHPRAGPPRRASKSRTPRTSVGPYALQDFNLFYMLRYGFRPSKIAFLAMHAWRDEKLGTGRPGSPRSAAAAYDLAEIRRWLEVFVKRFFGFASSSGARCPTGPRCRAGGSLSPRGDWRAPSDGNARAWLADIERNIPTA